MAEILIKSERGKKAVKLVDDGYGLELCTMRNGYQWAGSGVDEELIEMIQEVLDAYQAGKKS